MLILSYQSKQTRVTVVNCAIIFNYFLPTLLPCDLKHHLLGEAYIPTPLTSGTCDMPWPMGGEQTWNILYPIWSFESLECLSSFYVCMYLFRSPKEWQVLKRDCSFSLDSGINKTNAVKHSQPATFTDYMKDKRQMRFCGKPLRFGGYLSSKQGWLLQLTDSFWCFQANLSQNPFFTNIWHLLVK